jgi:choline dehydrogenase-like flavoprotein
VLTSFPDVSMKDLGSTLDVDVAALVSSLATKYNLPESVQKGLTAQYNVMKGWLDSDVPQIESIMNLWGNSAEGFKFEAAVQHPWARGTVFISSGNAFDMPKIDPNYLGVDQDIALLTAGVEFVRKVAGTAPLHDAVTDEAAPGAASTGEELTKWMREACGSEYHPIGTCPMLPRDMGGVVDTNLRVYGTANVRVIDASVAPLQVSAHTMAPAYGIAEKGADLIKAFYSTPPTVSNTTVSVGPMPSHTGSSTSTKPSTSVTPKATSSAASMAVSWAAVVAVLAIPMFL